MSSQTTTVADSPEPDVCDFLAADRITLDLDVGSRKRLFEHIAEISTARSAELSEHCVFKTINERERLGSTGLGNGIAIPHGRLENLPEPVISLVTLNDPVDYDAPDGLPVWLAVGLLVPEDATEVHLKLLAKLAGRFQQAEFIEAIKNCDTADNICKLFRDS